MSVEVAHRSSLRREEFLIIGKHESFLINTLELSGCKLIYNGECDLINLA